MSWWWSNVDFEYNGDDDNRMALGGSQSNSDILNTAINDNRGTAHISYDDDNFCLDENKDGLWLWHGTELTTYSWSFLLKSLSKSGVSLPEIIICLKLVCCFLSLTVTITQLESLPN